MRSLACNESCLVFVIVRYTESFGTLVKVQLFDTCVGILAVRVVLEFFVYSFCCCCLRAEIGFMVLIMHYHEFGHEVLEFEAYSCMRMCNDL